MPTDPSVKGHRAKAVYNALSDELSEMERHLNTATDAHTERNDRAFYLEQTDAKEHLRVIKDAVTKLSQGRYEEVENDLGTNW